MSSVNPILVRSSGIFQMTLIFSHMVSNHCERVRLVAAGSSQGASYAAKWTHLLTLSSFRLRASLGFFLLTLNDRCPAGQHVCFAASFSDLVGGGLAEPMSRYLELLRDFAVAEDLQLVVRALHQIRRGK